MTFTALEQDVLNWIAKHSTNPAVARQVATARPVAREYTGVGFFVDLEVDADLPRVSFGVSPLDPAIISPQLDCDGGSVLFFEGGLASMLELYANGDTFPEEVESWELRDPRIP